MFQGFKEFIARGNVIDLAVAVVIGAAFGSVVNSFVGGIINPLIGAVFAADSLDKALVWTIPTVSGGQAQITFGAVIGAIINFLIVALVVYFVFVLPINTMRKRAEAKRQAGDEPKDVPPTEQELLTQIRDLLAAQNSTPK